MEDKYKRMIEAAKEIVDQGIGEIHVKFMTDQRVLITQEPWVTNPTDTEIQETIERVKGFGFGGVEVANGKVVLLKKVKKINLV